MYTVVITETERARWTANQINKAIRHCKIGKVVEKRIVAPFKIPGGSSKPWWLHNGTALPTQIYMPNTCSVTP